MSLHATAGSLSLILHLSNSHSHLDGFGDPSPQLLSLPPQGVWRQVLDGGGGSGGTGASSHVAPLRAIVASERAAWSAAGAEPPLAALQGSCALPAPQ